MYTTCVMRAPWAKPRPGGQHLPRDLPHRQVAAQPHGPGEAEGAAEAAADLGGEAQGEAVLVGHEHGLDAGAVGEAEHELLAAVLRGCGPLQLGHPDLGALGQSLPEVARQVGHRREVGHAPPKDPAGELAAAIARRAEGFRQ